MPPRISVIVPIYNAASTLRAAVQSILTQDIAGLEVLLVDDGSTDATPGLCHDLALRDDRIQVITQKTPVSAPPATGGFPSLRACM